MRTWCHLRDSATGRFLRLHNGSRGTPRRRRRQARDNGGSGLRLAQEDANVSEKSDYFGVPAELEADGSSILIDAEETISLTLTRDGVSITVEFDERQANAFARDFHVARRYAAGTSLEPVISRPIAPADPSST